MSTALTPSPLAQRSRHSPVVGGRDDEAILAAVFNEVTADWFFEFEDDDGKTKRQISARGAYEYARIRGDLGHPIRFLDVIIRQTTHNGEVGMEASVTARDVRTSAESTAYVFRAHYVGIGTDRKRDEFNDRAAATEANRNAILKLIPLSHINALLKARTKLVRENERRFTAARKKALAERLRYAPRVETIAPGSAPAAPRSTTTLPALEDPYGLDDAPVTNDGPEA